ncbi:MAG: hypothetical protein AAFY60_02805, partial [Myxococcota bacterium]
ISEVVSVFLKHRLGRWNRHVSKPITARTYKKLIEQFSRDIHNGRLLYQCELSRYHVLGINLVAPVDHYYRFNRARKKKNRKPKPMGTFDQLIISMGIQLTKIHGTGNVAIVSSDNRLINILNKCRGSQVRSKSARQQMNMEFAEELTGVAFEADAFPVPVNLEKLSDNDLVQLFGVWPLPRGATEEPVYRAT